MYFGFSCISACYHQCNIPNERSLSIEADVCIIQEIIPYLMANTLSLRQWNRYWCNKLIMWLQNCLKQWILLCLHKWAMIDTNEHYSNDAIILEKYRYSKLFATESWAMFESWRERVERKCYVRIQNIHKFNMDLFIWSWSRSIKHWFDLNCSCFFFFASFCSICDLVIRCCFTGITDAIRLNREWRLHFERKTEAQNQRQKDQSNEMYTLNTFRTWYNPCTVYKSIQFYTATIKFILILLKSSLGFFSIRCFGFGFRGFCSISIHFQCGIFFPAFIFSLTYNEPNHLSWMICVNRIQCDTIVVSYADDDACWSRTWLSNVNEQSDTF